MNEEDRLIYDLFGIKAKQNPAGLASDLEAIRGKIEQLMRSTVATDFERENLGRAAAFIARAENELEEIE